VFVFREMEKNFYGILSVPRGASLTQIQSAYRAKALQLHPEQSKTDSAQAFEEAAEALQVLSDPKLRALYDQYGEDGLRSTLEQKGSLWRPSKTGAQTFEEFFGTKSSFEADVKSIFESKISPPPKLQPPTERNLYCSLEELFAGCVKHEKVVRQRCSEDGSSVWPEEVVFAITLQPGWRAGTRITFEKQGDHTPMCEPADLVFVVQEKPHPRFRRQGNNLLHTAQISLRAALTGLVLELETIDGRTIAVGLPQIVSPNTCKTVAGEGMPLARQPDTRGNLLIDFQIQFPSELSADAKSKLKMILPL